MTKFQFRRRVPNFGARFFTFFDKLSIFPIDQTHNWGYNIKGDNLSKEQKINENF